MESKQKLFKATLLAELTEHPELRVAEVMDIYAAIYPKSRLTTNSIEGVSNIISGLEKRGDVACEWCGSGRIVSVRKN